MKKKEYIIPEVIIKEIVLSKVIAQSYGNLGFAGGYIGENEVNGW